MTDTLNISIVLGSFRIGGTEKVMINLANGIAEKNIKCTLVALDRTGPLRSQISSKVNIVSLDELRARNAIRKFRNFLRTENPDVIIVSQTHVQIMAMLAVKWEKWKGKIILNEHSLFSYNNSSSFNKLLAKYLFNRADAITSVSKSVAVNFVENFPSLKSKVSVIHNAAFEDKILDLKNVAFHPDTKLPVILAVGRLTVSKNYKLLLDAFALVLKKKHAQLIFLGNGSEQSELAACAERLNISSNVTFRGSVENPYSYMKHCSVFVLTSAYEGLPTVLIEALACGCNIVCTEIPGGAGEILLDGKLGTIVPSNASKLADAIIINLKEKTGAAQKLIRAKEFSTDIAVFKYLSLINHLREEQ